MLTVMVLPSIINVAETALQAVPREYEEASLALGATETETYFRVSLPAARSGVAAAVVLGVERLHGAVVRCTDLRGGAALCAAALAAEGETAISDITHIDRGYQSIEDDLAALGADIRRVEETASP